MQVSIIGSESFIGRNLARKFTEVGASINLFSRRSKSRYDYPEQGVLQLVTKNEGLLIGSDVVVFCAGRGIQPNDSPSLQEIYEMNTFEPIRLIVSLESKGFRGLIITFGSYFEMGCSSANKRYSENEILFHENKLNNHYAYSKALLSKFHYEKLKEPRNCRLVHLLLTNVYGAGENGKRLIPYLFKALKEDRPIQLTSGFQKRQYTHVRDISSFIVERVVRANAQGIFNFTNPEILQVRKVVKTFFYLFNQKFNTTHTPSFGELSSKRDTGMPYLALDSSKAFSSFGQPDFTTLESGLSEYLDSELSAE